VTPLPKEQPITLIGSQDLSTKPFELVGGNYAIGWLASRSSTTGCFFDALLRGSNNGVTEIFGHSAASGANSTTGETQAYNVKNGQYYVHVIASCEEWAVVIAPQGTDTAPLLKQANLSTASAAVAQPQTWTVTFSGAKVGTQGALVANDYGQSRTLTPTGQYVTIFFTLTNNQKQSASVSGSDFKLTDAKGRTYTTDFSVRQVHADGSSDNYDRSEIVPGGNVLFLYICHVFSLPG